MYEGAKPKSKHNPFHKRYFLFCLKKALKAIEASMMNDINSGFNKADIFHVNTKRVSDTPSEGNDQNVGTV